MSYADDVQAYIDGVLQAACILPRRSLRMRSGGYWMDSGASTTVSRSSPSTRLLATNTWSSSSPKSTGCGFPWRRRIELAGSGWLHLCEIDGDYYLSCGLLAGSGWLHCKARR